VIVACASALPRDPPGPGAVGSRVGGGFGTASRAWRPKASDGFRTVKDPKIEDALGPPRRPGKE
jgi:hypothetical protein